MMRILILEDEPPAAAHLAKLLAACAPDSVVTGVSESVSDAVRLLRAGPAPDLIFADIRLNDGLSLGVFDLVEVSAPVVFVTAYDQYVLKAFELNAIDYLLKPVERDRLATTLAKYGRLQGHFTQRLTALTELLRSPVAAHGSVGAAPAYRERVIVRHTADHLALPVESIAWITTEHRLTLVVDRAGRRWLCDEPLADLEQALDPARFFRINRQHLVQVDAIARWRSGGKGRISVELTPPSDGDVVVSQESGAAFRAWMAR